VQRGGAGQAEAAAELQGQAVQRPAEVAHQLGLAARRTLHAVHDRLFEAEQPAGLRPQMDGVPVARQARVAASGVGRQLPLREALAGAQAGGARGTRLARLAALARRALRTGAQQQQALAVQPVAALLAPVGIDAQLQRAAGLRLGLQRQSQLARALGARGQALDALAQVHQTTQRGRQPAVEQGLEERRRELQELPTQRRFGEIFRVAQRRRKAAPVAAARRRQAPGAGLEGLRLAVPPQRGQGAQQAPGLQGGGRGFHTPPA
jgi:hypothetical protein